MNKYQRKEIGKILKRLQDIKNDISLYLNEEQEKYDNMPENLQMSEKAENIQEAISNLEEAESLVDDLIFSLENSICV